MQFIVEIEAYVGPQDEDLVRRFPTIIIDRFQGTAIKIRKVAVKDEDGKPIQVFNEDRRENT
jgi:hypothetical protein